ncbi:MAG TPA: hypothetical protein VK363_18215 [Pyrinomonadaceae bacterium]|nr:hypothetical protein [Pyrinomonadaceae bacterium]
MKFPLLVRSGGASLLVVSLLLSHAVRAQRPAPTKPAPVTTTTATATAQPATTAERSPAVTIDTMLSADAYGVYAEMRAVGRHANSQEIAQLLAPLGFAGAPDELTKLYEFVKSHADSLMTSRLMFAALPARSGLPEVMLAVEMPSVEEARKFVPELRQFIAANVAPAAPDEPALTTVGNATSSNTSGNRRRGRRRGRRAQNTMENTRGDSARPRAAAMPPVQIKRSGSVIAMSDDAFTFKTLRGTNDQGLLFDEPGFQAARTRFATDAIFVYFNTVRMSNSTRQKHEALEKEYRRQEELARAEERKRGNRANAMTVKMEQNIADDVITDDGNTNANVSATLSGNTNANANIATTGEETPPVPPTPEATPSPKTGKELEEERQREQSQRFARTMGSLMFGEGPASNSSWPESIGVGASLEEDALVLRGLFVNLSDDQPLRPIPFLPVLLSGPSIAAEAPSVLPAETDIFVSASLDLSQMYDYLASMMKILDLAASTSGEAGKEGGGFADQLTNFEKTNNFRIKEELLAALGNEIAVGLPGQFLGMFSGRTRAAEDAATPPLSGPIIIISLNDKEALRKLLPRVLASIGFAGATEQSIIEKRGDVEVLTFSNGTLAFIDRFLVGAPDAATMRRIADAYNNGQTLANSERFRTSVAWQSRQAVGQVYVSNAMLKSMFEDVTKSVEDIDDVLMRAYLLRLDPEPGSITHLATRESNGLVHEIHVPKNLLSLFTASAIVSERLSTMRSNESTAQWRLRTLHNAQNEYKAIKERFGTLEELRAAGQIREEDGLMEVNGYEIKLSVSGDKFEATATPTGYPKLGRRSFYIDQTGTLRGGDTGGKPATTDSTPIIE